MERMESGKTKQQDVIVLEAEEVAWATFTSEPVSCKVK
jgi:hypothetical protein